MKVNEVPEKIYLPIDDSLKTYARKDSDQEIEYARTDAFIEKACDYLSYHLDTSKIDVMYKFDFIEEFRKAMKI